MGKISPEFPNSDFFMKSKQRFGVSLRFGVCQSAVRGLPSENSFSILAQSWPTLRPYGLYHARLPCPSLTPRACSNSCPSSWWCHPTSSSSVNLFSCRQSFPGSFAMNQFFPSGGQSIGVSASALVLPMNVQDWE